MSLWIVAGSTFLGTLVSAPLVRRFLERRNLFDLPNVRSSHTRPVARGGGIAAGVGLFAGVFACFVTDLPLSGSVLPVAVTLAAVGFLDDHSGLPAVSRLAAQVLLGAIAGALVGGPVATAVGALVVPAVVNVVNFMDGINGMTSTTLIVWGSGSTAAGLVHDSVPLATLGAITAAAAGGFLPWNAPRASLFLGDVGSYLFGGLAAGGILLAVYEGVPLWTVLAPLSVYFFDVFVTLVRRAHRRQRLMTAHRQHIYQLLVRLGAPHFPVSLAVGVLACVVTVCWWTLPQVPAIGATITVLTIYAATPALVRNCQERHATRA